MAKNIIEKIWDAHVVKSKDGYPDIFAIDLHLIHEVTSPQAFEELRKRNLKVQKLNKTFATLDHIISTAQDRQLLTNPAAKHQVSALRENCEAAGVELFDFNSGSQGIVHVIGPELGLTQPGMTIACGDSHTSTHGAFGAIAFGIGTTEVSHVLATGCLLQKRPKTMRVNFKGKASKGFTAKDLILKLIQEIGIGGATGHIIEYAGTPIKNLSMEERMTVCNMSIECGARAGLIAPDETTYKFLRGRKYSPKNWPELKSDPGAKFDKEITINISNCAPIVTWGTNPSESVEIDKKIPKRKGSEKSLAYTRFKSGQKIEGTAVDYVFIGSCTNSRLPDLRAAAKIMKGKTIAPNVKVYVVPGSQKVRDEAIREGLDKIFTAAGADFRNPGCSMCLAMNEDKVPAGKRCATTSNRNFIGRQGPESISHLMSPIMAAAAAITGKITDVRKFL